MLAAAAAGHAITAMVVATLRALAVLAAAELAAA